MSKQYDYDAIIIGAGIGGLVCGCYLAHEGCSTLIVEQHDKPGGYCTSFKRKGYIFDAAVHYIGSVKRGVLSKILEELELDSLKLFTQFDPTDKIMLPNTEVCIRANPASTIGEFIKSFPEEETQIRKFFDFISTDNFFSIYSKIKKLTFKEILDTYFQNRELKEVFAALLANMGTPPDRVSAVNAIIFFREFILDPGYYPTGGMQKFTNKLVGLFEKLGGKIVLNKKVTKILLKNNSATGIILDNEEELLSQYVISNADATETYSELLAGHNAKESTHISTMRPTSSCCALYLGLKSNCKEILANKPNIWKINSGDLFSDLKDLRKSILSKPLPFGVIYSPSSHDTVATKTTLQVLVNAPYESEEFWQNHKEEMVNKMFELTQQIYPTLTDSDVEVKIGATPATFKRYTYNMGGAIYGWEKTVKNLDGALIPQNSSINNIFLSGHWITSGGGGGGISGVAAIGRATSRIILDKMNITWPWETYILK